MFNHRAARRRPRVAEGGRRRWTMVKVREWVMHLGSEVERRQRATMFNLVVSRQWWRMAGENVVQRFEFRGCFAVGHGEGKRRRWWRLEARAFTAGCHIASVCPFTKKKQARNANRVHENQLCDGFGMPHYFLHVRERHFRAPARGPGALTPPPTSRGGTARPIPGVRASEELALTPRQRGIRVATGVIELSINSIGVNHDLKSTKSLKVHEIRAIAHFLTHATSALQSNCAYTTHGFNHCIKIAMSSTFWIIKLEAITMGLIMAPPSRPRLPLFTCQLDCAQCVAPLFQHRDPLEPER
ncbi:hypothetical protein DFH09DRAFT_1087013 [Mycena vulgaris]|nr:hypothetical protein DFH09DRAFT_1087013 [Mycena vulgaris]